MDKPTVKTELNIDEITPPIVDLPFSHFAVRNDYNIVRDFRTIQRNILSEKIGNAEDFIAFVKEFSTPATKLFYNTVGLKAIFNYPTVDKCDFGDSMAVLRLEETQEFENFKRILGKPLTQKEFIRFLKQTEPYITSHDSISVIDIIQKLESVRKVTSINTNVRQNVSIDCEVKGALNKVEIPQNITLDLPIYKPTDDKLTRFYVELFYEDVDDTLKITPECWQLGKTVDDATRDIVKDVVSKIGLPSFMI